MKLRGRVDFGVVLKHRCCIYGENNPLYLGFEGVVENVDKIKVYAYPMTSVNLKGTVRFVLHGYSIGSNITLESQLG